MGAKGSLSGWAGRHGSPWYWIAVFGGSGLLRPAPGTWGTAAGLLILLPFWSSLKLQILIGMVILVSVIGAIAISQIEKISGVHDAPEVVIDEVAGQWIALLPLWGLSVSWNNTPLFAASFLLFRFFDILKPWPISFVDRRVDGGLGVMLDDILAGGAAAAVLYFGLGLLRP